MGWCEGDLVVEVQENISLDCEASVFWTHETTTRGRHPVEAPALFLAWLRREADQVEMARAH